MLLEVNQVGKREDIANYITRIDARSKPVLAMIPKGPPANNSLVQFQVDDFEEPTDNAAVDGEDVSVFDNASPNRAMLKTYVQKFRVAAMVSDFAENLSDVAGLKSGELAESIMKKLEKISRDIEAAICSDNEHQEGTGALPYKLRGLGMWIGGAQTVFPVPAAYATPAASLDNTPMANLTETIINNVLQSAFEQTGKVNNFDLVLGPTLKRVFSGFTRTQSATTNTFSSIRVYNNDASTKTITNVVDRYEGDFGNVNLHVSLFCGVLTSNAAMLRRGYLLIMDLLEWSYKRMPRVRQLEDRGGGPRFLIDAIGTLKVKNPKPLGKFYATT